ncbi:MAG: ATP-binding protein [Thermodesulfobacteriota bacterium]
MKEMNEKQRIEASEQRRRHREFYIILLLIPVIALITYIESHISIISGDVPVATNILVLGLINVNILLLVLLIFLILRNAVKFFFEGRRKLMGSRLRVKLVSAFIGLTIVPTFLLFFVVITFINKSVDGWFDIKVGDALGESLELAQDYYWNTSEERLAGAWRIARSVTDEGVVFDREALREFIDTKRREEDVSTVEVFSLQGLRTAYSISDRISQSMVPDIAAEQVASAFKGEAFSFVETVGEGDVIRAIAPVTAEEGGEIIGAVAVSYHVPRSLIAKVKGITAAFESYKQQKLIKTPVKTTYFMILLIITLLIVFFAIWIGQYLAKGITVPIQELAEGTHAVASGDLDYRINIESRDEIGLLVKSFNRMTEDLKEGKGRLEEANLALRNINVELDQRRRYIEIVLGDVPAGVIALDKAGKITSLNKVAADILGTEERYALGKNYEEVMRSRDIEVLREMIREMDEMGAETLERQIRVEVKDKVMTVLVNLSALRDEKGDYIGMVAVLDDLTHLMKTQRMVAWKEVAKRIAHEIKNPLTPIQLSAQRLRKKYLKKFDDDGSVFDECTRTIVKQVEELKTLVNEFSSFARMPAAEPGPNDLNEIVEEILSFYRGGHKKITFGASTDPRLPTLDIDRDQIKRAIINLVDNAIAAIDGSDGGSDGGGDGGGGEVRVETRLDEERKMALLEVVDTGSGIPEDYKARLFEPYFSTKKSGTGLGLAIVSNIIADHNGYIRVRDNVPRGTRFTIELPLKAVTI